MHSVHIIGGGLAGSEAAWQLALRGIPVILHEMRPLKNTDVHLTNQLAELVCSNSFRSDDAERSAIGLLHEEMRRLNSLILDAADKNRVPAGGALAVDRLGFSKTVEEHLFNHPLIEIQREEIVGLPPRSWKHVIIATGPLTGASLANALAKFTGEGSLAFFDAIAPIVHRDSINFNTAWFQSRYDKGNGSDYINCPLSKNKYDSFIKALSSAEKTEFKEWETTTPYFEGCLPIEVMAERGHKTLTFGPMKPVGLTDPNNPLTKPYAIVQLRQDNSLGTLFNMVGFQTKLKYSEQKRIFRMIPGLEKAEFARLGGIHRNTFINAPKVLDKELRLVKDQRIRLAGQITGCEGYVESAAIGLLCGLLTAAEISKSPFAPPPSQTCIGSLFSHITKNANAETYQPMNVNFGLFPPLEQRARKRDRKKLFTTRARKVFEMWKRTLD